MGARQLASNTSTRRDLRSSLGSRNNVIIDGDGAESVRNDLGQRVVHIASKRDPRTRVLLQVESGRGINWLVPD